MKKKYIIFLLLIYEIISAGVYSVDIDAEKQKVKVSGNVDSTTLINKLTKSGKYAELWPSNDQEITSLINGGNYQNQIQNLISSLNAPKSQPLLTNGYPRSLEEQLAFDRFLKQSMDMENHAQMSWNDRVGDNTNSSGFIDLEGSQLGGFGGNFIGGIKTYNDHQSSFPMMNMYQQNHPGNLIMNRNMMNMNRHGGMGNAMVHDNMYMQHPSPVFRHAHRAHY